MPCLGAYDLINLSASMSKKVLSLTLQESIRKGEAHFQKHPPQDKPCDSGCLRTVSDEEFKKIRIIDRRRHIAVSRNGQSRGGAA